MSRFTQEQIREAMLLYAVTDRAWLRGRTLKECVAQAIEGGATFVQLREKDAPFDEVVALGKELAVLCGVKSNGIGLIIPGIQRHVFT